ncbi:MAG: hypothetical protein MR556_01465 [Succinatimonas sp.]|nr:hypothetical protein [Succinatimonas sp.]
MAIVTCKKCGNHYSNFSIKGKIYGILIICFSVLAWKSFLFAGSGAAFLICLGIGILGVLVICFSTRSCPKCGSSKYSTRNEYIEEKTVSEIKSQSDKNSPATFEYSKSSSSLFQDAKYTISNTRNAIADFIHDPKTVKTTSDLIQDVKSAFTDGRKSLSILLQDMNRSAEELKRENEKKLQESQMKLKKKLSSMNEEQAESFIKTLETIDVDLAEECKRLLNQTNNF